MPRLDRLPPPPAVPPRSPPAAVQGEVTARVAGLSGGPSLDARVHLPEAEAVRAVVLCHPHPLYGGSMNSPVPLAIARCLSDRASASVAWMRFDFRGVGTSDGVYDDARGEVDDVRAAIAHLRRLTPGAPMSVCGHSFGSFVGLKAAILDGAVERVLLAAPSTRFFGAYGGVARFAGPTTIFIGDQDDFCDVGEARELARDLGAELRVFEGFDHHFMKSRRAMAEAALPVLAPEVGSP